MRERIHHKGVPVDDLSETEALGQFQRLVQGERRNNHLVTLTISMYNAAREDLSFRDILEEATLVLPESTGLMLYSRLHKPTFGKIPGGIYLARKAVELCSELDKRVLLVGSAPDNRREAARRLKERFPKLTIDVIEGEYAFTNTTDSQLVTSAVDAYSPDFVLMAGTQVEAETWIHKWLIHSGADANVVGNFGQTIDYEAGKKWIPPRFIHDRGLGWAARFFVLSNQRRTRFVKDVAKFGLIAFSDTKASLHQPSSVKRL